jgi:hypothetical protein
MHADQIVINFSTMSVGGGIALAALAMCITVVVVVFILRI